jgi:predicted ArsR family transcriptional regulator
VGASLTAWRPAEWLQGIADPVRLGVLRGLTEAERATAAELARHCEASGPTLRRHLAAMVALGLVTEENGESDGATTGRPAARFSLPPPVRESVREILALGT